MHLDYGWSLHICTHNKPNPYFARYWMGIYNEHNIYTCSTYNQYQVHKSFLPFMQVGPTYGRKTMKGLLASQGIVAGEKQIGNSLAIVQPEYHHRWLTKTEAETNPHLYSAQYFGHKLHIDQNEKLVMFGVTHICAIDGYSRKIVGMVSMPVKNCWENYNHVMR